MHWINHVYNEVFTCKSQNNFQHFKNIIEPIPYNLVFDYDDSKVDTNIDLNDTDNNDIFKKSMDL
jgi:hypothetical protein